MRVWETSVRQVCVGVGGERVPGERLGLAEGGVHGGRGCGRALTAVIGSSCWPSTHPLFVNTCTCTHATRGNNTREYACQKARTHARAQARTHERRTHTLTRVYKRRHTCQNSTHRSTTVFCDMVSRGREGRGRGGGIVPEGIVLFSLTPFCV